MRRDAEANRQRLIEVGQALLKKEGADFAIERFCEAAGINRATFYRHFPDRSALYGAILDHELASMTEAIADAADPLAFLTSLAEMQMIYDRFTASLPDIPEFADAAANDQKVRMAISAPLARAKVEGWVRAELDEDDILVIARMLSCNWRLDQQPSREATLKRRLQLVQRGISP